MLDKSEQINGVYVPPVLEQLESLDWSILRDEFKPSRFHGDFHFENILWQESSSKFVLLDWREDFAGDLELGDLNYDLAKLLHGILVSHPVVHRGQFEVNRLNGEYLIDIDRPLSLIDYEVEFRKWIDEKGYNIKAVELLTALIFLNICPLHHRDYDLFLFLLGRLLLRRAVEKI